MVYCTVSISDKRDLIKTYIFFNHMRENTFLSCHIFSRTFFQKQNITCDIITSHVNVINLTCRQLFRYLVALRIMARCIQIRLSCALKY